jgi:hypothetical protein
MALQPRRQPSQHNSCLFKLQRIVKSKDNPKLYLQLKCCKKNYDTSHNHNFIIISIVVAQHTTMGRVVWIVSSLSLSVTTFPKQPQIMKDALKLTTEHDTKTKGSQVIYSVKKWSQSLPNANLHDEV